MAETDESVLNQAAAWLKEGRKVALATVIETWGSAPQPVGSQLVIEGDKIVGDTPRLEPGEEFSYNSYHVAGCDAIAQRFVESRRFDRATKRFGIRPGFHVARKSMHVRGATFDARSAG